MIKIVEYLKRLFKCKTWAIESTFVLTVLITTAIIFDKRWEEWIGVFAVFYTFKHASVANRMEEAEKQREDSGETIMVECYRKAKHFFYLKETGWLLYFLLMETYTALAGVLIFLMYYPWRNYWRKHNPL